jgi:hypothetical protein
MRLLVVHNSPGARGGRESRDVRDAGRSVVLTSPACLAFLASLAHMAEPPHEIRWV